MYPRHKNVDNEDRRSKNELMIEMAFRGAKLSFCYEKPLGPYLPDFTIYYNDQVWYWEHLGLLESPDYLAGWLRKKEWYQKNGYWPRVIVTRDHKGSFRMPEINTALAVIGTEQTIIRDNIGVICMEQDLGKVNISATFDTQRTDSNSRVVRIWGFDRAKLPDDCLAILWNFTGQRNNRFIFASGGEKGSLLRSPTKASHDLLLRSGVAEHHSVFREFCCDKTRIKTMVTSARLVRVHDGWEIQIDIPPLQDRRDRATDIRKQIIRKGFSTTPVDDTVISVDAAVVNGHTNGHANGHANGHINGMANPSSPVDWSFIKRVASYQTNDENFKTQVILAALGRAD